MDGNHGVEVTLESFEALKKELRGERIKSGIAIFGTIISLFLSITVLSDSHTPLSAETVSAPPAPSPSLQSSYPADANFHGITTQSIAITDENGNKTAVLSSIGLAFFGNKQSIFFLNGNSVNSLDAILGGSGITFQSAKGATTNISPGEVVLGSATGSNGGNTTMFPGLIGLDTPQNYTVYLGALSTGPTAVGINIQNDHFDKAHANGAQVDKTQTLLTPENLSLNDSTGVLRTSIGETSLTTPSTGATSTTATSSITLFDKSGHVLWEAPQ